VVPAGNLEDRHTKLTRIPEKLAKL